MDIEANPTSAAAEEEEEEPRLKGPTSYNIAQNEDGQWVATHVMNPVISRSLDRDMMRKRRDSLRKFFYKSVIHGGVTQGALDYLKAQGFQLTDKLTDNGSTALHVAVATCSSMNCLETMLAGITYEDALLDLVNSDGSTLLHVAAAVGNTKAAELLFKRNPYLLLARDKKGRTPLFLSLSNMHSETSWCMYNHIAAQEHPRTVLQTLFHRKSGDELIVIAISSGNFGLAYEMVVDCMFIPNWIPFLNGEVVLMAIAENYPTGLDYWVNIEKEVIDVHAYAKTKFAEDDYACSSLFNGIRRYFRLILYYTVRPFIGRRLKDCCEASKLLWRVCFVLFLAPNSIGSFSFIPVFQAARHNKSTVIRAVLHYFPEAIWASNEDGHNFIQLAVIHRSESIYNLMYEMSLHNHIYKTIKDHSGNNLLHLAARLAPTNKLNATRGAALQLQRELQWFKEVEEFGCFMNKIEKNSDGETPGMVFTREHRHLVIAGEKWMKATANSYTITAALIVTIMFAAAVTVPGGNDQESGIPIFSRNAAFWVFAVCDAISLFSSLTSLLMFLSILTTRYAEQDFLFKLPTRLIIGLSALFISTTSMVLAFGATLFIVFRHGHGRVDSMRIFIPIIGGLTCLPIACFVQLQFPLIKDLMMATYGTVFGKRRSRQFIY